MTKEDLLLLAKFSTRARKFLGAIDSVRLSKDPAYRAIVWAKTFVEADQESMLLAWELKEAFSNTKSNTKKIPD